MWPRAASLRVLLMSSAYPIVPTMTVSTPRAGTGLARRMKSKMQGSQTAAIVGSAPRRGVEARLTDIHGDAQAIAQPALEAHKLVQCPPFEVAVDQHEMPLADARMGVGAQDRNGLWRRQGHDSAHG
jgi:hypothetical protein